MLTESPSYPAAPPRYRGRTGPPTSLSKIIKPWWRAQELLRGATLPDGDLQLALPTINWHFNSKQATLMTTLAAWVGVDQRAPASLYIVSDSRFTRRGWFCWKVVTNQGQKIFACQREPHLFGYYGWVEFPSKTLAKAVRSIDAGEFFGNTTDPSERHLIFERYIKEALASQLETDPVRAEFALVHATRDKDGMDSLFRLWILEWHPITGWKRYERGLTKSSEVLYADGSGAKSFSQRDQSWKDSEIGRTSRGVFSAFVEALQGKYDPHSGGAPQLGGLFRKGRAIEFGIVYDRHLYFKGKPVSACDVPPDLECFNELFERVDPITLKRLPKAQRHAKPSWLRPYDPNSLD